MRCSYVIFASLNSFTSLIGLAKKTDEVVQRQKADTHLIVYDSFNQDERLN